MPSAIFINLPVADLGQSIRFYEAVGATKDPRFSDETAACMVLSEAVHVMLLTHAKFSQFTRKRIVDARTSTEVLLCLPVESREAVDTLVDAAAGAGGTADPGPQQDCGFMVARSFEDPDGHIWEVMWMDMAAAEAALGGSAAAAA